MRNSNNKQTPPENLIRLESGELIDLTGFIELIETYSNTSHKNAQETFDSFIDEVNRAARILWINFDTRGDDIEGLHHAFNFFTYFGDFLKSVEIHSSKKGGSHV